ncbi:ribosomal protein L11 methyltransferase [Arcticibacter tournemirensis]|uniref:Ribosomal protein L11 methyltransferase n=1 Tax=Arcticibacter tournemirensis TaxID=699437 RepID=A0A5M9H6M6_9SPHI|nr:50S ribosomal protein L11 methyltransferase [Arcticibacter tournemirensis]KAA8481815.1 50S ribosomal protein L11 methyltransferase [Arcticibacter tournemirensis]TQM50149.1 ribosomal protein L11 methyltransferase [Arcticibacter tournemirensis]
MDYFELKFTIDSKEDFHRDLLLNAVAEAGFDTFEETPLGFNAYISSEKYNQSQLNALLEPFEDMFGFSYVEGLIPQKNWNEVWESNFDPITVSNQCYIRATFHQPHPEYPYEIVIDPKMAFGTGHHQTTAMMMEFMLEANIQGNTVLDMGCGTGILAILARKIGAASVTAIDYDPICYESTIENAALNNISGIEVLCGSKEMIPDKKFDIVFANINRNILLDQFERYADAVKAGGELFISGFYEVDCPVLLEAADKYSFVFTAKKQLNDWTSLKLLKK